MTRLTEKIEEARRIFATYDQPPESVREALWPSVDYRAAIVEDMQQIKKMYRRDAAKRLRRMREKKDANLRVLWEQV